MKKLFILSTVLLLASCTSNNIALKQYQNLNNEETISKKYKNIIMFIGDGMGPNHVDAGGIYLGEPLTFDKTDENWAYHAYSNTDSLSSEGFTLDTSKSLLRPEENASLYDGTPSPYGGTNLGQSGVVTTYTDSAAGGSALACGEKFVNSQIGLDIFGNPVENLVEIAHGLGKKTGVVSSDNLVGATPSDFLVHVASRHMKEEIIEGVASSKADLVLTQIEETYKTNQSTYESLFTSNGFDIAYDTNSLNKESERILGLFPGVMALRDPRAPTLSELTAFSLDYLDNEEGFFLMVEGSNIDKDSHANQTREMMRELIGFNNAVKVAENWASTRDDTLIVVTADHETGGLYYNRNTATQETILDDIKWLTQNHSRTRVDIAVRGDITAFVNKHEHNFSTLEGLPYWDNTDVFKLCATYLGNSKYI